MLEKWLSRWREELLPWHANDTLTAFERIVVERWLRRSSEARARLAGWRRLRQAVADQELRTPSPSTWRRVMTRVREPDAARLQRRMPLGLTWAWGTVLTLAVLIMLWVVIQPGIVLQWSVSDGPPVAFRVYRAPVGSADFSLLHEEPARPDVQRYTYVDARPWPVRTYVYRVEGVRRSGQSSALSPAVTASALDALPGQLALLCTSLIVGYGAVILAQWWKFGGRGGLSLSRLAL